MHDLVRLFARERARLDDGFLSLAAARARLYGSWLSLGNQAHTSLFGRFYPNVGQPVAQQTPGALGNTLAKKPLAWLETEQQNLSAVMRHAVLEGDGVTCWQLASTFSPLLEAARAFDDWLNLLETGATTVRTADDSYGEAVLTYWLGRLWTSRLSIDESWRLYEAAQRGFREVADSHAIAVVSLDMAVLERFRGNSEAALDLYHQALPVLRQHSDLVREAIGLRGIGQIYLENLDYAAAIRSPHLSAKDRMRRIEHAEAPELLALQRSPGERARHRRVVLRRADDEAASTVHELEHQREEEDQNSYNVQPIPGS